MTNDLIILNFLKEKGVGCKTDLISLLKELYPTAVDGTVEELEVVAPIVKNLFNELIDDKLIKADIGNLFWLGTSTASVYSYLDNVRLSASITSKGVQYLVSLNPRSTQNINVSGNSNNINQSSFDNSLDKSINQTINPADLPIKKNAIISFIEKFWWTVAIPLIIGLLLIVIEHNFF